MNAATPLPPPPLSGWSLSESPFHVGELAAQERAAVRDKLAEVGRRVIRRFLPEQHRAFYTQLPFVVAGAVDISGWPWATILAAPAGFLTSPDPELLEIATEPSPGDPLHGTWEAGLNVGLLGIELPTRRRNRVNGTLERLAADTLRLRVAQSFGNCPKYIQTREPRWVDAAPGAATSRNRLSKADRELIAAADTFFIASASGAATGAASGADVSHRGGLPGFVAIDGDGVLTTPDYVGNNLFNTLGNLMLDPHAGLLFVDWASGDLLHVAVTAEIVWGGPSLAAFPGAQRLVRFRPHAVVRRDRALPLRWSDPGFSPFLTRAARAANDKE